MYVHSPGTLPESNNGVNIYSAKLRVRGSSCNLTELNSKVSK